MEFTGLGWGLTTYFSEGNDEFWISVTSSCLKGLVTESFRDDLLNASLTRLANIVQLTVRYSVVEHTSLIAIKLSLCLTKHHAMKAYWESGGTAPRILWPRH
jgi:hypothetical protein